ncbi:MAG TPA: hypothetical protein VGI10_06820 [Polyangiaceae bacterium]|jgi:hypothetical protein
MTMRSWAAHGSAISMAWVLFVACAREPSRETSGDQTQAVAASASVAASVSAVSPSRATFLKALARDCEGICAHSFELKCSHAVDCKLNCIAMGSIAACQPEFSAFYRCLLAQPADHFSCDADDGVAAINEGFCDQEQQASLHCMEQNVHP